LESAKFRQENSLEDTEYLIAAARTDIPDYHVMAERLNDEFTLKVLHAAMGMVTEAGEIMDAVKKHVMYGKPLDLINLFEESGDSFWYQALLARACNFTFQDCKARNIAKLKSRYPEKFTVDHALFRDLDAERKALE
jgi:NTP pyrophosphatase (non-canonical NTP hydrolase)